MEYLKGPSYLPTTSQVQEESLKLPLLTDASGGSPSWCRFSVSKVFSNLVVALLLFSMGMMMYNTNCSFPVLAMLDSSKSPHWKSAHFESISSTAAEVRFNRRLRGIAQYLSIPPAAIVRGGVFQLPATARDQVQVQVHYDAAPPSEPELLPKDTLPKQVLPSRGLAQVEPMQGESRWPNLNFQQKMHPMPNGPDPIHNRFSTGIPVTTDVASDMMEIVVENERNALSPSHALCQAMLWLICLLSLI